MNKETYSNPWFEVLARYLPAFREAWDDARTGSNPFATVTMAYLKALETRGDPDSRYRWKMAIWRRLCESPCEPDQTLDLLALVDWLMQLPPDLETEFADIIEEYEEEKKMDHVTTFERRGLAKGIEVGVRLGEAAVLRRLLARRFDGLPVWVRDLLDRASRRQLESWAERVLDAGRLEDVFAPGMNNAGGVRADPSGG